MRLLDFPTNIDAYRTVRIESIKEDTPSVKVFTFKDELCNRAKAGQYIMLWIQGVDEIPLSLSVINCKGRSSISVKNVGEATEALHGRTTGGFINIRGPYGNSFNVFEGNVLVVGGGIGVAPLLPLLDSLVKIRSTEVNFVFSSSMHLPPS